MRMGEKAIVVNLQLPSHNSWTSEAKDEALR
jgi:hypothetical protein